MFITHSSVDRELAEALVRMLRLGTDVPADRIFCSSVEGFGIPTGVDFLQYIQAQLQATELIVPLITPAYLDSTFCMWELGAAWVREVATYPVLVQPVTVRNLQGPLGAMQVASLNKTGLNGLANRVAEATGGQRNLDLWERERDALLDLADEILDRLRQEWNHTPLAQLRRAARHADAASTVHEAMHQLRDAGFVHLVHAGSTGHAGEFLALLRHAATAMAKTFSTTSGARCRAIIKQLLVDEDSEAVFVQDVMRSEGSRPVRARDLVEENTDFNVLLEGEGNYFMCNNLEALRSAGQYRNSHVGTADPLPYAATIVWPIRKVLDDLSTAETVGAVSDWQDLIGFLCVDSQVPDTFDEADVATGAAFADALYNILRPYLLPPEA